MGEFTQDDETQAKLAAALAAKGDFFNDGWKAGKRYAFETGHRDIHRALACIRGIGVDLLHCNRSDEELAHAAEGAMKLHDELIKKWKEPPR